MWTRFIELFNMMDAWTYSCRPLEFFFCTSTSQCHSARRKRKKRTVSQSRDQCEIFALTHLTQLVRYQAHMWTLSSLQPGEVLSRRRAIWTPTCESRKCRMLPRRKLFRQAREIGCNQVRRVRGSTVDTPTIRQSEWNAQSDWNGERKSYSEHEPKVWHTESLALSPHGQSGSLENLCEIVYVGNSAPQQGRRQASTHYSKFGSAKNSVCETEQAQISNLRLHDREIDGLSENGL